MTVAYTVFPDTIEVKRVRFEGAPKAAIMGKWLADDRAVLTPIVGGNTIIWLSGNVGDEWAFHNVEGENDTVTLNGDDPDAIVIKGAAIIVGPKDDNGEFMDVTLSDKELFDRVGFSADKAAKLADLADKIREIGKTATAKFEQAVADGDKRAIELLMKLNRAGNDNAFNRDHITNDELDRCGCDECMDELARRSAEGATAKQAGATLH
jgi:hypothetical protein